MTAAGKATKDLIPHHRGNQRKFRPILAALLTIVLIILPSACGTPPVSPPTTPVSPTLALKIGQMLMVGFRGLQVDASSPIMRDIRERWLGGVILFDRDVELKSDVRNVQSPEQVQALTAALQKEAAIPLLVAVDEEGGKVDRLKEKYGFPPTVSAQELGSINDLAATRQHGERIAQTLKRAGINFNFAPVVDLNLNPSNPSIGALGRSFSADSGTVVRHATAFIQGHHAQGILCTIKHFPGLGSAMADTHLGVTDLSNTWNFSELVPFQQLTKAGLPDAVMTAHSFNSNLDPSWPATLSPSTVSGLLRERLKYQGVVICDDLQMGAIRQQYSLEDTVRQAILAGCDILLFANNLTYEEDIVSQVVAIVTKLVADGEISEARIDQSYQRIQQLKAKIGQVRTP